MSKVFLFMLAGLLVCLPGSSIASSDGVDTPLDEKGQCDVTIRGNHGGASGSIELQLGESDVRNRVGWWTKIGGGIVTLETRERFSSVVSLDFGCNAHRRYRFYFEANVDGTRYQYMHYIPNEDDFTQQTLIDLGDVSRFFDAIEPAPELPSDEPLAGIELEGEWIRRESNNDPNDGMRINVRGQTATLTFVPPAASSFWQVGDVLWQGVSETGEIEVRGSNGSYYAAQLSANGLNQLELDIDLSAAGDEQTWVRGQIVLSGDSGPVIGDECSDVIALDPSIAAIVDRVAEDLITEQEIMGMAVGVIQSGQITHLNAYGWQNREDEVQATVETVFRWASISKTLTALAALSMWEQEDLDLDADINSNGLLTTTEFPVKRVNGSSVTLTMRDILSMTAGIRHYRELRAWNPNYQSTNRLNTIYPRSNTYDPIAALGIFNGAPLATAPPARTNPNPPPANLPLPAPGSFLYSTFGFMLAGAVLERAAANAYGFPTGDYASAFEQLVQEHIAEPLCMTSLQTDFPGRSAPESRRYRKTRNNIVVPHTPDSFSDDEDVSWKLPGGGFASNISDLARLARGLMDSDILEPATHDTLNAPVVMAGTRQYSYGFEFYDSNARQGHAGDHNSSRASMYFYPATDRGLVILVNSGHASRGRLRLAIEEALGWRTNDGAYNLYSSGDPGGGPVDCDSTTQSASSNRFAGVWHQDATGNQVLRRGYTRAASRTERARLAVQGYHMTDIESFESEGERLWDIVYTQGAPETLLRRNDDTQLFHDKWEEFSSDGWRLVDIETYENSSGERRWDGIFVRSSGRHALFRNYGTQAFHDKRDEMSEIGLRLIDLETYVGQDGERLWAGVFREGTGRHALFRNFSTAEFGSKRTELRDQGFRLIDVETYRGSGGERLWAGVWRADSQVELLNRNMRFCGIWQGHTGFWNRHEQWRGQGYGLDDYEHYE